MNVYGYTVSRIRFEPIKSNAYGFEEKLKLILNAIQPHQENIIQLSKKASTIIQICRHQYLHSNAGMGIGADVIERLSKLNIGIDIDTYIYE